MTFVKVETRGSFIAIDPISLNLWCCTYYITNNSGVYVYITYFFCEMSFNLIPMGHRASGNIQHSENIFYKGLV